MLFAYCIILTLLSRVYTCLAALYNAARLLYQTLGSLCYSSIRLPCIYPICRFSRSSVPSAPLPLSRLFSCLFLSCFLFVYADGCLYIFTGTFRRPTSSNSLYYLPVSYPLPLPTTRDPISNLPLSLYNLYYLDHSSLLLCFLFLSSIAILFALLPSALFSVCILAEIASSLVLYFTNPIRPLLADYSLFSFCSSPLPIC